MRPPICEVCDEDFDPDDGGLIACVPGRQSATPSERGPERPGAVGHPPDQGWFCPRHVDSARRLGASKTLDEVVAELAESDGADPDLAGVDLGAGSVRHSRFRPDSSYVAWTTPHRIATVVRILVEAVPEYLEALGVPDPAPALELTTKRTWTPMDGAVEPNCPFTDERRWLGSGDGLEIEISATEAFWNEDEVSNTSASLSVWRAGARILRVSHSQRLDSGGGAASVWLWRPASGSLVELTRRLFDC